MKYLNQLSCESIPYPTDLNHPDSEFAVNGTVRRAGCGLCCACMMVDRLTEESFSLEACRDLAVETRANLEPGTDMEILAAALAQRFDLSLTMTDDVSRLAACLREGGCGIINVGGDREGHLGIFSHQGHFILAVSVCGEEFCLLDPSWTEDKYDELYRQEVRRNGHWLYADAALLQQDTANRSPAYYLFQRKSDLT